MAATACIQGFAGNPIQSGDSSLQLPGPCTSGPRDTLAGWRPQSMDFSGTRTHSSHSGAAYDLDFTTASSVCDTDTENLLAPSPPGTRGLKREGCRGRVHRPPLNLCQQLKSVSEETEIVHFLSRRCPGKYFTGQNPNIGNPGKTPSLPSLPPPALSKLHHFKRDGRWDLQQTGPVKRAQASSHAEPRP